MGKQVKKEPRLSIKVNGIERTLKKSNSFPWILPEKIEEQENVIVLDDKRKKKKGVRKVKAKMDDEEVQLNKGKRRNREGIFFVLFAVIIGVGFGFGLLKMIQSSAGQAVSSVESSANQEKVSTTLESLEAYVLQSGVFTDASRAKKLKEQLLEEGTPAAIIEEEQVYVISGIAGSEESINKIKENEKTYQKTFVVPAADMKSSSKQESEKIMLTRSIIGKLLQAGESTPKKEWTELEKQVETLKKMKSSEKDQELYEATLNAYKVLKSDNGSVNKETQQALLNCFSDYQKFIFEATK